MLSSSLTHSITKAYHIMPHNQTQYYHTLLISIPLKATGNDPSYTMHQLSYLAQPKQPKTAQQQPRKDHKSAHTRIAYAHTRIAHA